MRPPAGAPGKAGGRQDAGWAAATAASKILRSRILVLVRSIAAAYFEGERVYESGARGRVPRVIEWTRAAHNRPRKDRPYEQDRRAHAHRTRGRGLPAARRAF